MSVIGFDDVMAAYLHPRLTTVSHMLVQMGRRAAELALELAEEPAARARLAGYRDVLVPELVARDRAPARPGEAPARPGEKRPRVLPGAGGASGVSFLHHVVCSYSRCCYRP